jgi:hypothetical protein
VKYEEPGTRRGGGGASQAVGEHGGMVAQTVPPSSRRHSDRLSVTTQYNARLSFRSGMSVKHRKQDVDLLKVVVTVVLIGMRATEVEEEVRPAPGPWL